MINRTEKVEIENICLALIHKKKKISRETLIDIIEKYEIQNNLSYSEDDLDDMIIAIIDDLKEFIY